MPAPQVTEPLDVTAHALPGCFARPVGSAPDPLTRKQVEEALGDNVPMTHPATAHRMLKILGMRSELGRQCSSESFVQFFKQSVRQDRGEQVPLLPFLSLPLRLLFIDSLKPPPHPELGVFSALLFYHIDAAREGGK